MTVAVHAELRALFSADVENLRAHAPEPPFGFTMRALIGPRGGEGEESFDVFVCSPEWLADELKQDPIISGRSRLIMSAFDYDRVEAYVRKQIAFATGDTWSEVAAKLSRWSSWEFKDYVERD